MAQDVESQCGPLRHMRGYCPETKTWISIRVNEDGEIVIDPIDTDKIADGAITSAKMTIEWTDWTPTYGAQSPMTFTSIVTNLAKYCVIDKILYFVIKATGTTGGTASKYIFFSVPVSIADNTIAYICGGCNVVDTGREAGYWFNYNASDIRVYKYDTTNWGLGTNREICLQGFYRIA